MKTIYKIIQHENLKLETSLSKDELLKRLANNIEPRSASRNWFTGRSSSSKYFEGSLHENGFKINRIISYRNSFLPTIIGEIESLKFGTTLSLKLRLNAITLVIGAVWLAGIIATGIAAIASY
ncbi:MAG: hypothetical protein P8P74_16415 [Crocinitomicaceae bacterium]|nr:hypothetical protein [Crocinitomicaceae bacterium]